MYTHTHIHTYTHTHIHTYTHTYIHTCTHAQSTTRVRVCVCVIHLTDNDERATLALIGEAPIKAVPVDTPSLVLRRAKCLSVILLRAMLHHITSLPSTTLLDAFCASCNASLLAGTS